ncbi:MAG: PilZ domain-containing protein [Novosphingobium sp.]
MSSSETVVRRSERLRITCHARYRTAAQGDHDVVIINVDSYGCCLEPKGPCPGVGQQLLIRLESGESLTGEVRWTRDGRVGVAFNEVFDRTRVEYLRREHSTFLSETEWPEEKVVRSVM